MIKNQHYHEKKYRLTAILNSTAAKKVKIILTLPGYSPNTKPPSTHLTKFY